jgi:serine/threonine-protein kinase RsbW
VKKSPTHILVIKSKLDELYKVEQFLKEIFKRHELPDACFNKVFLCVSEAVNNSIIHGNKQLIHRQIEVNINCKEKTISITVSDEGEGFDIKTIPDPTHKDNILKESGRGLHIIKSISETVEFNEQAKGLHFQINCT